VIPVVLLWGAVVGFFYAAAHRTLMINLGGLAAVLVWWVLLFTVGEIGVRVEVVVFAGVIALMNYAVGVLIGWGIVSLLRRAFGMTTE
jgi:hypothetical protein